METLSKEKPRRETGLHERLMLQYALFSLTANLFGSIFWWAEQRRWQVADQLDAMQW
jgi:hypothetical protein